MPRVKLRPSPIRDVADRTQPDGANTESRRVDVAFL